MTYVIGKTNGEHQVSAGHFRLSSTGIQVRHAEQTSVKKIAWHTPSYPPISAERLSQYDNH